MKNNIQNIIRFYKDCYQSEYSTEKVSNFYSKTVSNLYYPKTFELLSKNEYELPVSTEWGNKVGIELKFESSEKKLVCGSFFLKGKMDLLGKSYRIFTPLFLNDVTLKYSNEVYYLIVNQESISLNPIAINYLNLLAENPIYQYDEISTHLLEDPDLFSFSGLIKLQNYLNTKYPKLNIELLEKRIETDSIISNLDTIYKSRKNEYRNILFPDILVGLTEKPKRSKDVINELIDLSGRKHNDSSILSNIFQYPDFEYSIINNDSKKQEIVVPVSLSQSQEKILKSANQSKVTVVIGPPGTGKSFSIAALAIQAFQEGKKILIASKNEQACQVLFNKIQEDIGIKGITINSSKARYRISVSTKLRNIANGVGIKSIDENYLKKVKNEVLLLKKKTRTIIDKITYREAIEKKWGEKLSSSSESIFSKIQKKWISYRHGLKEPIWELKFQLHEIDRRLKKKEKRLIRLTYEYNLYKLLSQSRPDLIRYEKAFKETRGNVIKDIFSSVNFNIILEALPIWICKSSDVANIVPLKEGLFDLLIIDEASQCDISSSIPLLYRAKSIAIVGDPNQLRHLSFISNRREELTKTKYNLSGLNLAYRDKSILDLVNEAVKSQNNIIFLNEHFRSMPDIISFSNNHFYSGQLKIMTDHLNENAYDNLKVNVIEGGIRNDKGENLNEAKEILSVIELRIQQEVELCKSSSSTIGVISPFRNQVQLIKRLVRERIAPSEINKHKLLIGTPFKFQGEERDIVFLSFTIDEKTHQGSIRYLERPDVFNVSITRAKNTKEVYISMNPNKLNKETLLSKYLCSKPPNQFRAEENRVYDEFLEEVKQSLEELNSGKIQTDRKICGTSLDIILIQNDRTLGIDLIGYPGEFTNQLTIEEIMSLERAKISIFLLTYSTWYFDKELCIKALTEFVKN